MRILTIFGLLVSLAFCGNTIEWYGIDLKAQSKLSRVSHLDKIICDEIKSGDNIYILREVFELMSNKQQIDLLKCAKQSTGTSGTVLVMPSDSLSIHNSPPFMFYIQNFEKFDMIFINGTVRSLTLLNDSLIVGSKAVLDEVQERE